MAGSQLPRSDSALALDVTPNGNGRIAAVERKVRTLAPDMSDESRTAIVNEMLLATPVEVRQRINRLRTSIEVYAEEYRMANAGDESLTLTPYSDNIFLVETVIAQGPASCTTMTLQLEQKLFTFTNPISGLFWNDVKLRLMPQDIRKLTWAPAAAGGGDVFLLLLGEQMPEVNY